MLMIKCLCFFLDMFTFSNISANLPIPKFKSNLLIDAPLHCFQRLAGLYNICPEHAAEFYRSFNAARALGNCTVLAESYLRMGTIRLTGAGSVIPSLSLRDPIECTLIRPQILFVCCLPPHFCSRTAYSAEFGFPVNSDGCMDWPCHYFTAGSHFRRVPFYLPKQSYVDNLFETRGNNCAYFDSKGVNISWDWRSFVGKFGAIDSLAIAPPSRPSVLDKRKRSYALSNIDLKNNDLVVLVSNKYTAQMIIRLMPHQNSQEPVLMSIDVIDGYVTMKLDKKVDGFYSFQIASGKLPLIIMPAVESSWWGFLILDFSIPSRMRIVDSDTLHGIVVCASSEPRTTLCDFSSSPPYSLLDRDPILPAPSFDCVNPRHESIKQVDYCSCYSK